MKSFSSSQNFCSISWNVHMLSINPICLSEDVSVSFLLFKAFFCAKYIFRLLRIFIAVFFIFIHLFPFISFMSDKRKVKSKMLFNPVCNQFSFSWLLLKCCSYVVFSNFVDSSSYGFPCDYFKLVSFSLLDQYVDNCSSDFETYWP